MTFNLQITDVWDIQDRAPVGLPEPQTDENMQQLPTHLQKRIERSMQTAAIIMQIARRSRMAV